MAGSVPFCAADSVEAYFLKNANELLCEAVAIGGEFRFVDLHDEEDRGDSADGHADNREILKRFCAVVVTVSSVTQGKEGQLFSRESVRQ